MTASFIVISRAKKTFAGIALVTLLALASAGYLWRNSVRSRIAREASAATPNLDRANPELADRVRDSLNQIQRGRKPVAALSTLAHLYYANGWYGPAERVCAGLVQLEPGNPRWLYLLALLRSNSGQLNEALPLLEQTIKLAPDYLPARLKAAATMTKLNQLEAAIAMEKGVLEREPDNIYARAGLGNIYVSQKKWDLARDAFQRAIAVSSSFRPAWVGMVAVYEAASNAEAAAEARAHVDEVSRSPDSPDPWIEAILEECYDVYFLRVTAFSNSDLGYSRRLLERAVKLQPGDAAAHRDLGMLLFRAEDFREARNHLVKATTLTPADSENWLSLITFLRAIRDEAGIDQAVRNGLSHCRSSSGLWLEWGRKLQRNRDFNGAIAAFAKAAEYGPKDANPHVESAASYFQLENSEKGLAELNTALALQPNHPFAVALMARYAIVVRDKGTARAFMEKVRRNPKILPEDKTQLEGAFKAEFGAASF